MTYDRRDWQERELVALKQEIAERLRSVCEHLSVEDFDELVDRIARMQRKYEQVRLDDFAGRRQSAEEP